MSYTIPIAIGKTDRTLDVDLERLFARTGDPVAFILMLQRDPVAMYSFKYGLTQCLNDSHSQITAKSDPDEKLRADKAWNLANKKLDALYAGELRAERVGKPRDPVMAEAMILAENFLVNQFVEKGDDEATARKRVAKLDKAKVAAWSRDWLTRNPEKMEMARKIVEMRGETISQGGGGVDIESLMADPVPDVAEAA